MHQTYTEHEFTLSEDVSDIQYTKGAEVDIDGREMNVF